MQSVELRKCTLEDIRELRAIALQSYQEHYSYLWTEDKYVQWYMDISFGEQSLRKQMNTPGSDFYFVLYNGEKVGFLKTNTYYSPDNTSSSKNIELERIYLLKEATNKGVGKKAIDIIINQAKQDQLQTIWLKAMDRSKALQFYQKMGFSIIKTELLPYEGFKDEYRNIHTMSLTIY